MSGSMARRRLLLLVPLGFVAAAGAAFLAMLNRMGSGKFDPHAIGDTMLGHEVPQFDLPGLGSHPGFSTAALKAEAAKQPVLVNFFASWCIPCAQEADVLAGVGQLGLTLWGIAYEDKLPNAEKFLGQYGNPYARIANDQPGRVAIDFGVYGVPESFLIDRNGRIAWHVAGPLTDDIVRGPLQRALQATVADRSALGAGG